MQSGQKVKTTCGFGGRGYKFDESEKEMKRMKQRLQQAAMDPEVAAEMEQKATEEDMDLVCLLLFSVVFI